MLAAFLGLLGYLAVVVGITFGIVGIICVFANDNKKTSLLLVSVLCLGIGWPLSNNCDSKMKARQVLQHDYRLQVITVDDEYGNPESKTNLLWGKSNGR